MEGEEAVRPPTPTTHTPGHPLTSHHSGVCTAIQSSVQWRGRGRWERGGGGGGEERHAGEGKAREKAGLA